MEEPILNLSLLKALNIKVHHLFILTGIAIGGAVLEGFGVSLLYPILQYVEKGSAVFDGSGTGRAWQLLVKGMLWLHLPTTLLTLLCISFSAILLRQVFNYVNLVWLARVQYACVARLQTEIFEKILASDLSFFEGTSRGKLTNTLIVETSRAGQLVHLFFQLVTTVVLLLAYSLCIGYLSLKLTAIALLNFAIVQFLIRKQVNLSGKYGGLITKSNDSFAHLVSEKISALRLIKLHHTQEEEIKLLQSTTAELAHNMVEFNKSGVKVQVMIEPTLILGTFIILYIAATYLHMNLALVSLFVFMLIRVLPLAKYANLLIQGLKGYQPSILNLLALIQEATEQTRIQSGSRVFTFLKKGITIRNVSFQYNPGKPVLHNLNISIPAGSTTAIVGHSGAGKSTLTDLLLHLRNVREGEILFDDTPLKEFELGSLRKAVGFVSQDVLLLNDTVEKNLTYGLKNIASEEVIEALKMSHSWEFVQRLQKGMKTIIGDRGIKLSGGERQRLCLARALLRKPSLLILDEPTSSLDSESEKYIQQTIQDIRKGLTLIIIAHRFSTIRDADQILVVENGTVKDFGSHDELITNSPLYNKLFKLQFQQTGS